MNPQEAQRRFVEWVAIVGRFYRLRVHDGDRVPGVLPGAADVLRKLRATGIAMAVATGSLREVAELKLATSGLRDYFPVGAFGDEVSDRADLVRQAVKQASVRYGRKFLAANAVVIGDTPADIGAARETGARVGADGTGGLVRRLIRGSGRRPLPRSDGGWSERRGAVGRDGRWRRCPRPARRVG